MSTDYEIWEPGRREKVDAELYHGNTPKEAGIAYVLDDYDDDPRAPEERLLRVRRVMDGITWAVHLEPVVICNWRGVASVVAEETPQP